MRPFLSSIIATCTVGLLAGGAWAQNLELEVIAPKNAAGTAEVIYNTQQDLRVNYSFTGADATNTVVVVDPPQGVIIRDASAPDGWTINCQQNPDASASGYYKQFRWRCTFTNASVIVPAGGGVNGQLSIRVQAAIHHDPEGPRTFTFGASGSINGGAAVTASASAIGTPTPVKVRRYQDGIGSQGTFVAPDGGVGVDVLAFIGPWNDGQARIAAGSEHRLTFADNNIKYVSNPNLGNFANVSPAARLGYNPMDAWTTSQLMTFTFEAPVGMTYAYAQGNAPKGNRGELTTFGYNLYPRFSVPCAAGTANANALYRDLSYTEEYWGVKLADVTTPKVKLSGLDSSWVEARKNSFIGCTTTDRVTQGNLSSFQIGQNSTLGSYTRFPVGHPDLTDIFHLMELPELPDIRFSQIYSNYNLVGNSALQDKFTMYGCNLPNTVVTETWGVGDLDAAVAAGTCVIVPKAGGTQLGGYTHVAFHADAMKFDYLGGKWTPNHMYFNLYVPVTCADAGTYSFKAKTDFRLNAASTEVLTSNFSASIPILDGSYTYPQIWRIVNAAGQDVVSGEAGQTYTMWTYPSTGMARNPNAIAKFPKGVTVVGNPRWSSWNGSCANPAIVSTKTVAADGVTTVNVDLGGDSLFYWGSTCQTTDCQPAGYGNVLFDIYVDKAANFADGTIVTPTVLWDAENNLYIPPYTVGRNLTINAPAQKELRLEPVCSGSAAPGDCAAGVTNNRDLGVRITLDNTGGRNLTGLSAIVKVPKSGEQGTQVNTTWKAWGALPAGVTADCSNDNKASWVACSASATHVRVRTAALVEYQTVSVDLFLGVPANATTGAKVYARGEMTSAELLPIQGQSIAPSLVRVCPGDLAVNLFFDEDGDGMRSDTESGVPDWEVVITTFDDEVLVYDVAANGRFTTTLPQGAYDWLVRPKTAPTASTWSATNGLSGTLNVCPDEITPLLVPLGCTCNDVPQCQEGICNFLGACSFEDAGPYDIADDTCDGVDDNCNGTDDEDYESVSTSCGEGECAAQGTTSCVNGTVVGACTPGQPTTETCDGKDNDCDGLVDAADPTLQLVACDKTQGVCKGSMKPRTLCVSNGDGGARWEACTNGIYAGWAFESGTTYSLDEAGGCDGKDNDCDGTVDEGFVGTQVSCGLGACVATRTTTCVSGSINNSCTPNSAAATTETCDGGDNDCDGLVDAADPTLQVVACQEQRGVCSGSTTTRNLCVGAAWQGCGPTQYGANYSSSDSTCDGKDNNCNGSTDESYAPTTTACGTGACAGNTGVMACRANGVLENTCNPLSGATNERCNNIDDDCDASVDEGFSLNQNCSVGVGACAATGTTVCASTGATTTCSATAGTPQAERCDGEGVDGNCDGVSDAIEFSLGETCTVGRGACTRTGTRICLPNGAAGCSVTPGAGTAELCDGIDNNCDGLVDENGTGGSVCKDVETEIDTCPDSPTSATSYLFQYFETISDGSTFECKLDNGPWGRCDNGELNVSELGDGSHTFLVRALGLQGRFDTTPAFCVWTVDTSAPDTYIVVSPENPSQVGSGTFVFDSNVRNPEAYYCVLSEGDRTEVLPALSEYMECNAVYDFADLADGQYTMHVYVVSAAGVADQSPATYTWLVDTNLPGTALTTVPDPIICGSTTFIGFSSPTDEGLSTFECSLDGGDWYACSAPGVNLGELMVGNHIFDVRAIDSTGNRDPSPSRVAFTVDLTPPVATIATGPDDPSQRGTATFAFAADDAGATFQCALGNGQDAPVGDEDFVTCTSPWNYNGLADGEYEFHVRALGRYCGTGDAAVYTWLIDSTFPDTVYITTPPAQVGTEHAAAFTYEDPNDSNVYEFECSLDAGEWVACDDGATGFEPLPVGSHQLLVRSCKYVGAGDASVRRCDPTPAAYSWVVTVSQCPLDVDAPAMSCPARTVLECVNGGAGFDAAMLGVTAEDPCGATVSFEGAVEGFYPVGLSPVVFSAVDGNNNVATCVAEVQVTDTVMPTATCPANIETTTDDGACAAVVDVGAATVADACYGTNLSVYSDAPIFFVPGTTEVTYTALDAAGNFAECVTTVTVVDDEALTLTCEETLTQVAPSDACGWQGVLEAEAIDNCAVDVTIVEEENFFAVGTQNVTFNAADDAGNSDTCVTVLTVVDETAPTVDCGLVELAEGDSREAPLFVQVKAEDACGVVVAIENLVCVVLDANGAETELAAADCPVTIEDGVLTVSGSVTGGDLRVRYVARATDPSDNTTTMDCEVDFDQDRDEDGVPDVRDNCPDTANTDQVDTDDDGLGDACDNCPEVANADQADSSASGVGDLCRDVDEDSVLDIEDNCVTDANEDQNDVDGDGVGDSCDPVNDGTVAQGSGCQGGNTGLGGFGFGLLGLMALAFFARRRREV